MPPGHPIYSPRGRVTLWKGLARNEKQEMAVPPLQYFCGYSSCAFDLNSCQFTLIFPLIYNPQDWNEYFPNQL